MRKLTEQQVELMREKYRAAAGSIKIVEIAREFGITPTGAAAIIYGSSYPRALRCLAIFGQCHSLIWGGL